MGAAVLPRLRSFCTRLQACLGTNTNVIDNTQLSPGKFAKGLDATEPAFRLLAEMAAGTSRITAVITTSTGQRPGQSLESGYEVLVERVVAVLSF